MAAFLSQFPPVLQALFATIFTWAVTALGAAFVFVNKTLSHKLVDLMLGFAAGVMIAASFFSLLLPSIDMAQSAGLPSRCIIFLRVWRWAWLLAQSQRGSLLPA